MTSGTFWDFLIPFNPPCRETSQHPLPPTYCGLHISISPRRLLCRHLRPDPPPPPRLLPPTTAAAAREGIQLLQQRQRPQRLRRQLQRRRRAQLRFEPKLATRSPPAPTRTRGRPTSRRRHGVGTGRTYDVCKSRGNPFKRALVRDRRRRRPSH